MTYEAADLLQLLPEVYRVRDADEGGALAGVMAVIAEQAVRVDNDILQLYDDWFIETCQEWLTPYVGDLLQVRNLNPVTAGTSSQRAFVANTLRYRRAKGTISVLELLAFDVTGWRARAVEFFQLLGTAQYIKHIRPRNFRTPDLRDSARLELLGGPFDTTAHTAEVRAPARGGRYNLPVVGLSLWRIQSYPLTGVKPHNVQPNAYTFSPLGLDQALFNPGADAPSEDRLATEADVPQPLRRRPLYDELRGSGPAVYFGTDPVLRVFRQAGEVVRPNLHVCDLSSWTQPASGVSVDPVLGRLVAADASWAPVAVDYAYGFSGDLGGGPYDRRAAVACWFDPKVRKVDWRARVRASAAAGSTDPYPDLASAVSAWNTFQQQNAPALGVIAIEDSSSYNIAGLPSVVIPAGTRLVIIAAGVPNPSVKGELDPVGMRPHLYGGDLSVSGTAPAQADAPGELILHGLLIEGRVVVVPGNLGRLRIDHCTLLPRPSVPPNIVNSLDATANAGLEVAICRSISGRVSVHTAALLSLEDSIVDGVVSLETPADVVAIDGTGTPARIDTTTVLGTTRTQTLTASNSLFFQRVTVDRRQSGCVRFCYVPGNSTTPRRFRCQPDMAIVAPGAPPEADVRRRLQPWFTGVAYGNAGYGQLRRRTAIELRTGAEDASEFGAFSFLKQPQRERNLLAALDEYLRAELTAGIFYET